MEKYILAGVGDVVFYDGQGNQIVRSKTFTETSLNVTVTAEDIRGGLSNPILGKYFHDSMLAGKFTDALFDLNYMALNTGGNIVVGGDATAQESVTTTAENTITVQGTPVAFGSSGTIGWYTVEGEDNWHTITFTGKSATVSGLATQTNVCVRYIAYSDSVKTFTIPASIIPDEAHAVVTLPLFSAGAGNVTQSSKVGNLIVDIPRFIFDGNYELNMTATGASTNELSGTALAYTDVASCDDMSKYATVTMDILGTSWIDGLKTLAIEGADVRLSTTGTTSTTLSVVGLYNDGSTTNALASKLTFSVVGGGSDIATVTNAGVVTAVGAGTATISVVATATATLSDPIECYASVTVS